MAKLYTKTTWVDEELDGEETYDLIDSSSEPIHEGITIDLATTVVTPGTQVTAARMNNIEAGIDALDDLMDGFDLDDLASVDLTGAAVGDRLVYDGTDWVPDPEPVPTVEAITPTTGSVAVDFSKDYLTHDITGNIVYTSSNLVAGRSVAIKITCDDTLRTLAFPEGWIFLTEKPADIEADAVAVLSLTSFGAVDGSVIAAYVLEVTA